MFRRLMDRIREQLMWKALCAVDEATEEADVRPVKPSFALRFALAYLFSCDNGERWAYDWFWREMQRPTPTDGRRCGRGTMVRTGLEAIMRSVGVTPTFESLQALKARRARLSPEATARRRMATALNDEAAAQRARAVEAAKAKDCGWL